MSKLSFSKYVLYMALIIALLASFSGLAPVSAQPTQALSEDWRNEDYSFSARMMTTDLNGNIYVVGDTVVGDYLVIKKFSAAGALLWQTTHDPAERLRGVWIAVDSGNNPVVLASMITGSSAQPAGWLTLKYDTNGALLWANGLPGPYSDARRVAIDASNNIYVAGRMWLNNSTGNISLDSVLIKYDPAGARLWTASFDNGGAVDEPYSLVISPDSSRIGVAGISGNLFMALMYDPNGNRLWANTNSNVYAANDLAFGPGNISYFATGTYFPQDPNPYQMAITKFDAAGNQLSIKSYSVGDRTYRVRVDGQGNVVATGIDQAGYLDWMTIKTDANGNLLWSRRYDGGRNNDEIPNMLVLGASDAVYVTGRGGPNPSTGTVSYLKGVIVKYNSDGTPQWAVWDPYANGGAISLGAGNTLAGVSWAYLVTSHYTETGLPDLLPAAPTNLSGSAGFTGSSYVANLYFADNASNEFWVDVERCTGSGCTDFSKIGQTLGENSTGFRDSNVARGVTYTYRVRAVGFMGVSGYSNTVEVSVPPPSLPAAPSNLTTAMSGSNVVLNWQDNSTNEIQFYIERCQGAGCTSFAGVGSTGANEITWTDFNAAAGQSYSYRMRAWNSDGYSDYSNTATIVTPGGTPPPLPAPSNLVAAMSGTSVVLNWQDNATNEIQFYVEKCQGTGCTMFVEVGATGANVTTWTDAYVVAGQSYSYRVRALHSVGYSAYSNIATIVIPGGPPLPPSAPSNLSAQALSKSQIRLSWTNNSVNQDGVKIERCRGASCTNFTQIATVAGTVTIYTDSGLAANTSYRYRVRAYNSAGNSPYSNTSGAKTLRR